MKKLVVVTAAVTALAAAGTASAADTSGTGAWSHSTGTASWSMPKLERGSIRPHPLGGIRFRVRERGASSTWN